MGIRVNLKFKVVGISLFFRDSDYFRLLFGTLY